MERTVATIIQCLILIFPPFQRTLTFVSDIPLSLSLSLSLSPPPPSLRLHFLHIPDSDGSHPFYLDVRNGGLSHGVFLRNSDPMDVILSNDALQYRVIGGEPAYCYEYTHVPRPSCLLLCDNVIHDA